MMLTWTLHTVATHLVHPQTVSFPDQAQFFVGKLARAGTGCSPVGDHAKVLTLDRVLADHVQQPMQCPTPGTGQGALDGLNSLLGTSCSAEWRGAASPEASWQLLLKATQLDRKGALMGSPLVSTPQARTALRQALQVAVGTPWAPAGWAPPRAPAQGPSHPPLGSDSSLAQQIAAPLQSSHAANEPYEERVPEVHNCADDSEEVDPVHRRSSPEVPAVLLSVLASDIQLAARALEDYCRGLGVPMPQITMRDGKPANSLRGPVYVKYNVAKQQCIASSHQGRDRGVLLQLGTEQLGHLPLGLFDDVVSPPPA